MCGETWGCRAEVVVHTEVAFVDRELLSIGGFHCMW
jgi:hypothetical protein